MGRRSSAPPVRLPGFVAFIGEILTVFCDVFLSQGPPLLLPEALPPLPEVPLLRLLVLLHLPPHLPLLLLLCKVAVVAVECCQVFIIFIYCQICKKQRFSSGVFYICNFLNHCLNHSFICTRSWIYHGSGFCFRNWICSRPRGRRLHFRWPLRPCPCCRRPRSCSCRPCCHHDPLCL